MSTPVPLAEPHEPVHPFRDTHLCPSRSNSLASTNSNASGVSLTRRSRTRTRARTLTGSRPENVTLPPSPTVPGSEPCLGSNVTSEPEHIPAFEVTTPTQANFEATPPRLPRSPRRSEVFEGSLGIDALLAEGTLPAQRTTFTDGNTSITGVFDRNRPLLASASVPNSPVDRKHARSNVTDSVLTHQSTTSSSLFPASTTSASGPNSPPSSPRSASQHYTGNVISYHDPEAAESRGFDEDDVSYRLRLLVKNNYFLPPAHSKPSSSDLASSSLKQPKKSPRSTTPTFLDLFRVGRAKSKQTTPESSTESLHPILRTTSDSTTASGYAPRLQNPQSMPQTPSRSHTQTHQDRAARVVVVREKMEDLITAAKQAEQEMKARESRRDRDLGSQRPQPNICDDIDPTDAVDLPPLSDGYPFAVQASATHGLGVQDSLGAAVLAEQLPPLDPEEEAWRRALLHEAVGHSLTSLHTPNSSLSTSSYSTQNAVTAPSTPPSPTTSSVNSSNLKLMIGQPILAPHRMEHHNDDPPLSAVSPPGDLFSSSGRRGRILSSAESHSSASRPSSYLPRRAETPAAFHPLAPPPRRHANQVYSRSQSDISSADRSRDSSSSGMASDLKRLRKIMSSPMLSDSYESDVRPGMVMTPPPVPIVSISASRQSILSPGTMSSFAMHERMDSIISASSHYSDEVENGPPLRQSMTLSIPTDGRPSMSEYSQPSPTVSAFGDALEGYRYPGPSQGVEQHGGSDEHSASASRVLSSSPAPRYSTMSPPPRVSSSLANVALSPPPRSSSLRYEPRNPASISSPCQSIESTPPHPIAERRGLLAIPTTLHIPTGHIPVAVQSAPPPSSPTSFFDLIEETHPNAVDDLDSSDESGVEDSYRLPVREPIPDTQNTSTRVDAATTAFTNPRPRAVSNRVDFKGPSFMRLGNNSTPHVSRYHMGSSLSATAVDRRLPIGNTPHHASYFTSKKPGKSDQGHIPVSTFDFYTQQQRPLRLNREPSMEQKQEALPSHSIREWQSKQKAQESLRKLDGMLLQHMEAERDTIKRIASSVVTKI